MVVLQSQQLTSNTPVNVIFEYIQDLNNLKTAFNKVAKDWSNTNNTIFFRFAFIFFSQFCFVLLNLETSSCMTTPRTVTCAVQSAAAGAFSTRDCVKIPS